MDVWHQVDDYIILKLGTGYLWKYATLVIDLRNPIGEQLREQA